MSTAEDIDSFLVNLGLKLRKQWLNSCLEELNNSMPGFCNLNVPDKGKHIMQKFLFSNMNTSCGGGGGGVLPENIQTLHKVNLPGPFVLQVDEIVNLNAHPQERHKEVPAGIKRCLKLSMTDGVQRVFGFEDRPIEDLHVLAPAGLKVIVRNVHVRDGFLVLVRESLEVLGGMVEDLEDAHMKLVEEANEPLWRTTITNVFDANVAMASETDIAEEEFAGSGRRPNIERNPSYNASGEIAVDNSHRLTGDDEEIPLRYLDDFLSDWEVKKMDGVPFIRRKIRCIITGVNSFKFENRTEYELTIPVFDGSRLCTNVSIHHSLVQNLIGYSPEEINAAGVNLLENIGDRFEAVFSDFRGTMLVEMNKYSTIPVVLEITDQDQDDDTDWILSKSYEIDREFGNM
ncbi:hypothetical protein MKW98_011513 [Papaver atlanticum]|uniref:RecQ-mediated genome instability protein 1 n=1 Tax=Papaver atlanticum TaxID=357466 RepID=A0AAD4SMW3_9MAGN|nr:hypothetical protein MKW98_011513 [Papaver atlanticum]